MALPPQFVDELRARTPIAGVIGRQVKLARAGKAQKGCCPFHAEKTPSFYVYDDDFHCFGCGAHGDVFTFIMKTTGAAFMEVVERLAGEAGLSVPAMSPQAAQVERARAGIGEVLAQAAACYRRWLFEPQGRAALDYLTARGLRKATIETFGLGWSGEGRGQLAAALRDRDIAPAQLIEAGLMKEGDRGPVDMFFARVMFPIADRRGQLMAGARWAMGSQNMSTGRRPRHSPNGAHSTG
jgi:DNA primase